MSNHGSHQLPFYTHEQVQRTLSLDALIPAMEAALVAFSSKSAVQPVRSTVASKEAEGFLGVMPAYLPGSGLGCKLVTWYPRNQGVPTHNAIVAIFDPKTGVPLAMMDGGLITELRTAAVSAVATKYLAPPGASVLCILGSGLQARSHFHALNLVCAFQEVRIWSRTPENAAKCANELGARACASAEEAVTGADVIVVATSSKEPVLFGRWVKRGAHVNSIGATRPTYREMDDELLHSCVLIADSREGANNESGDVILSLQPIAGELGEVVAGTVSVDRTQTTVFKSMGMAVEDVAAAALVHAAISAAGSA